ncbi:MAG: hypothetical protein ACREIU_14155 [Planctomycetota bacterium]
MRSPRLLPLFLAASMAAGCRSITVRPTSTTAGSFRAEARAVRLLGRSFPYHAISNAFEVASDRGLPNARVTSASKGPNLFFPFTWLHWFLGFEWASVEGVYGNPP